MATEVPGDGEGDGWSSDQDSFDETIWIRAAYGVIASLGICGNCLVIFTITRVKALQNLTNFFIASLAATDFITSVFLIPLNMGIEINVPDGTAGDFVCRLFLSKFPLWTSFVASVMNLTCVTLERYVGIMHPLRYHALFTLRKCVVMVFIVWGIAFLTNIYMLYIFYEEDGSCLIAWPSDFVQVFDGILNFLVIYFIPLVVMGICYVRIMKNLRDNAARLRSEAVSGPDDKMALELLEARKKVIKMLFTVVVTFAVCWAPNQFMFLAYNLGWNLDFRSWYYHVSVLMAFCNSCMNPFIYAFQNNRYRRALQKAVCCAPVCKNKIGIDVPTISYIDTALVESQKNY